MTQFKRKPPLCACGCGERVNWNKGGLNRWNKFISGHNSKGNKHALGLKHPEEFRKHMSIIMSGKNNSRYGKSHSEKTRKKISQKMKGKESPRKGCILSENTKRKISKNHIGKHHSKKTKRKISLATKGQNNPMFGKGHLTAGSKNGNWRGGIAKDPYCLIWSDKEYRNFINERDDNKCQNPDCWKKSIIIVTHHIDYNKQNCTKENIVTLCASCNSRANKNRHLHTKFYQNIMTERYGYQYEQV